MYNFVEAPQTIYSPKLAIREPRSWLILSSACKLQAIFSRGIQIELDYTEDERTATNANVADVATVADVVKNFFFFNCLVYLKSIAKKPS